MDKQYFTKERLEELKAELGVLKSHKRLEIAEKLQKAKELGDLSENSEYIETREEQTQVERRIFGLEEIIKHAEIIRKKQPIGIVQIGSAIEVEKDGQRMKFIIVGSHEAKPEDGLISNESPLGRAFLGRKTDEKVSVAIPTGKAEYKIISIN